MPTDAVCKHRHVTVNERADYYVCTDIDDFRCVLGYDSAPTPTGTGYVKCRDCGATVKYTMRRKRLPEWVLDAILVFEEGSDAD